MKPSAGAKGPDELREQIARTRTQLGNTVQELAGKTDVKGRARARAADLRDKAGAMTVQLRSSAAQAGHTVQGKAAKAGHTVQGKAAKAGHTVQGRAAKGGHAARSAADGAGHLARGGSTRVERAAEDTAGPVRRLVGAGRRHPRPLLLAALATVGAVMAAGAVRRRRDGRC